MLLRLRGDNRLLYATQTLLRLSQRQAKIRYFTSRSWPISRTSTLPPAACSVPTATKRTTRPIRHSRPARARQVASRLSSFLHFPDTPQRPNPVSKCGMCRRRFGRYGWLNQPAFAGEELAE